MIATTRVSVYRGSTSEDIYGDEQDDNAVPVPGLSDLPMGLIEVNRSVQDATSGTWHTVRAAVGRVQRAVEFQEGDRIRDNRDGRIYVVDDVQSTPRSIAGAAAVKLRLTILDGVGDGGGTPPDVIVIDGGAPDTVNDAEWDGGEL